VDAVKKGAVRTVGSYVEFKNLVACAHLRPLSRKDIQSVAQRTQGWTTSSSAGGKINVRGGEKGVGRKGLTPMGGSCSPSSFSSSSSPSSSSSSTTTTTTSSTTPLAFERDWQRLVRSGKSGQEKLAFLRAVGGASFIRRGYIMGKKRREMNADVLGDLLVVLWEGLKEKEEEKKGGEGCREEKRDVVREESEREEDRAMAVGISMDALEILQALTQIDRFQITLALLSKPQLEAAREIVKKLESEEKVEDKGRMHCLEEVRRAFSFSAGGGKRKLEEAR